MEKGSQEPREGVQSFAEAEFATCQSPKQCPVGGVGGMLTFICRYDPVRASLMA